jgi:hypothetical protein
MAILTSFAPALIGEKASVKLNAAVIAAVPKNFLNLNPP